MCVYIYIYIYIYVYVYVYVYIYIYVYIIYLKNEAKFRRFIASSKALERPGTVRRWRRAGHGRGMDSKETAAAAEALATCTGLERSAGLSLPQVLSVLFSSPLQT